ncbi:MAG TPA: hypothetical protein VK177_18955 [Flavobacteriales bacterium]|nr:hypothetical protein [Flavobacteriales bacterium]
MRFLTIGLPECSFVGLAGYNPLKSTFLAINPGLGIPFSLVLLFQQLQFALTQEYISLLF